MTNARVLLSSSSCLLTLTRDVKGVGDWYQVHLLVSHVDRPLGAAPLKDFAAQLVSFLADNSPGLRWVLSFSELHTSAYGEHVAGGAVIHLQDVDAKWFAKLALTTDEKSQWIQELSRHC